MPVCCGHSCQSLFLLTDYPGDSLIDCDSITEVEGGWMLGGVHKVPTPHIRIVTAPLRADGDHSLYLAAGMSGPLVAVFPWQWCVAMTISVLYLCS